MCPLPSVKILRAKNDIVADVEVIPHPEVNEDVRAYAEGRCKVPLCHRHGIIEVALVIPLERRTVMHD